MPDLLTSFNGALASEKSRPHMVCTKHRIVYCGVRDDSMVGKISRLIEGSSGKVENPQVQVGYSWELM